MAYFIHEDTLQKVRAGFDTEPYKSDSKWVCNNDNLERYNDLLNTVKEPTLEEAIGNKIDFIKNEAGRIIVSKYPEWKQRNLSARFIELLDKGDLSEDEQKEKDAIYSVWDWVKNIRSQSDNMEAEVEAMNNISDIANYQIGYQV